MLEVRKKNLDRREWYSDSDRDFSCVYHKDEFFDGGIGLVTFTGIPKPDEVETKDGILCIADKGYQWLELAPKNGNYVLTAMFHGDELFQHYIDITLKNEVSENGDAVFYDLFLDVVLNEKGECNVIDTEELDEALSTGVISKADYDMAIKTAEEIVDFYKQKAFEIEKKLMEYRSLMIS